MSVAKELIKDCGDYDSIEGINPKGIKANCCPFCDTYTFSGSWAPDKCPKCGAVFFFNAWTRDKKMEKGKKQLIDDKHKKSGLMQTCLIWLVIASVCIGIIVATIYWF